MTFNFQRDDDELTEIKRRLMHARDLDIDEIQELYYRKNFLESLRDINDHPSDYGDDE